MCHSHRKILYALTSAHNNCVGGGDEVESNKRRVTESKRKTPFQLYNNDLHSVEGTLFCLEIPLEMDDQNLVASLYPPPPPYVKFFTRENIEKLEKYRKKANGEELNLKEEDKHLEFLIPPKQPDTETYRSFGNIWKFNDKIPKLEEMGIAQLYKEPESSASENSNFRIQELKKLLKSLLLNFLEITGVMSVSPENFNTKVEHIRTILINIHHLLNEYRPHQSRESLILLLEKQVEIKKHDVKGIENACKKVEDEIRELVSIYADGKDAGNTRSALAKSEQANDDIEMANTETTIKTEDSS